MNSSQKLGIRITGVLALIGFLLTSRLAEAYDLKTHADISKYAVQKSNYSRYLMNMGLTSLDQTLSDGLIHFPTKLSVVDWVREGSRREDDFLFLRFLNHFYNPLNGEGLSGAFAGRPSLEWGLEPTDLALQSYSYKDAQGYFYRGLTGPSKADREANLALTFRTLGHVIHLIQDLAQPQHTRNDSHGVYSYYEEFTNRPDIRKDLPFGSYDPVYSNVDPTSFNEPRNFWHTGENSPSGVLTGKGMADYSNRGFVTAGTNFTGTATDIRPDPEFPYPNGVGAVIEKIQITDLLPNQPLWGEIWFIRTAVADTYLGGVPDIVRTSTFSIFDEDLTHYANLDGVFSLNRFNFLDAHKYLIPRAVGYSAGLINYFFRGQMEITLPDDGIYAIVDHASDATTPAGCGTPCGFRKIKLKLKNTTPNDEMPSGKLVAVAKYHLNTCYTPNLSGEAGAPGFSASCRSTDEFIVVSNEKAGQAVGRTADALEFTFPDTTPIPINATDLYLQVVYKGKLGLEDDAVAVTTIDVREPTYLTFGDHYDYQAFYNDDGSFARTEPFAGPGRYSVNIEVRFNPNRLQPTAASAQLDPGNYHRIAILTDRQIVDYSLSERYLPDPGFLTRPWSFSATVNQNDAQNQPLNLPIYTTLRLMTAVDWVYMPNLPGSVIYWGSSASCLHGTTCNPVDQTVDAVARRYPPFQQPSAKPMIIDF